MTLDEIERGTLEKIIDKTVEMIQDIIPAARDPSLKKLIQIDKEEDFVMGMSFGVIYADFMNYLITTKNRKTSADDHKELAVIIARRAREMKEAIFKAG